MLKIKQFVIIFSVDLLIPQFKNSESLALRKLLSAWPLLDAKCEE